MSTHFLRHQPATAKALGLQLLLFSHGPILVNAQFRMYGGSYYRPSWYIGLIFLLLTFLIVFGIVLIIYFRQRRRHTGASPGSSVAAASHRGTCTAGLDPDTVKAFPLLTYTEACKKASGVGLADCAVCLSAFEEHETLRLMPTCGHAFHPACVDAWLASHTTCPCCRADLLLCLTVPQEDSPSSSSSTTRAVKVSNDAVVDVEPARAGAR